MAKRLSSLIKKAMISFLRLSGRERAMISFTLACIAVFIGYSAVAVVQAHVLETERVLKVRGEQLNDLSQVVRRYKTLNSRLERLQRTFAQSQMTFREVTDQLDRIIRQSIGTNTYDLKKAGSPVQIGFEYEKQAFTLNIRSLTLEQVTKLLYQLEQGDSPLFLGKVDLVRSSADNTFVATLEIFSIQKKS